MYVEWVTSLQSWKGSQNLNEHSLKRVDRDMISLTEITIQLWGLVTHSTCKIISNAFCFFFVFLGNDIFISDQKVKASKSNRNTQFYRIKGVARGGPPTNNFWTVNFTIFLKFEIFFEQPFWSHCGAISRKLLIKSQNQNIFPIFKMNPIRCWISFPTIYSLLG